MSKFSEALDSGRFLVTAELAPPKGVDVSKVLRTAELVKDVVTAFNVTDQQGSVMRASPMAVARLLSDRGIEPILQITARDRNRISLQSDLLGASILGLENILCLTGDPASTGDHPDAKPVFDLDGAGIVKAARTLESGVDLAGHKLEGAPRFCIGAAANPGAKPLEPEIEKTKRKADSGVRFLQTQPIFDTDEIAAFLEKIRGLNVAVLAGVMFLKSPRAARFVNDNIPGVHVPDHVIQELERSKDPRQTAVDLASRTIREMKSTCRGVHFMAMGWESLIPVALREAGLAS